MKFNLWLSRIFLASLLFTPHTFAASLKDLKCWYKLAEIEAAETAAYDEVEWLGQPFSKKQWEFFRRVGYPEKNIFPVWPGERTSLEIIDFSVRKFIDEHALRFTYDSKLVIEQSIMPHTKEDAALLKHAMKSVPHEVARARALLNNGDVLISKIVHGGFGEVSPENVFKSLKNKLRELKIKKKDIIEIEYSHVHPTHEYINISKKLKSTRSGHNRYHLVPLSFNDLNPVVFRKMFKGINTPKGHSRH